MTTTITRLFKQRCKRCRHWFRYERAEGSRGRLRFYCGPCKKLEIRDTNDMRPRRSMQRRCTHWSRQEVADAHPA